jgi:hypothetical protein
MKHLLRLLAFAIMATALPAFADSTTSQLPNGGLVQTTDMIPVARCTYAGCNYRVTVGPIASLNIGAGLNSSSGSLILDPTQANSWSGLQTFLSGDLTAADPVFTGGSVLLPSGATSLRPSSPVNGMIRYNTSLTSLEAYVAGAWGPVGVVSSGSAGTLQIAGSSGSFGQYPGLSCAAHRWLSSLDPTGASSADCVQPAFADLSGTPTTRAGYGITDALSNASTISAAGPIGGAATVPVLTYNTTGQLTNVSTASITPSAIGALPSTGSKTVAGGTTFTSPVTITSNATTLPSAQTGTLLQIGNADGTPSRNEVDSFGSASYFSGVRRDGTNASPTTLQSGDEIASLNAWGYNGTSVVGPQAAYREYASQNWSVGANGTYLSLATTPNGSATLTEGLRVENDGGITVPSTVTGGDKGAGTINAAGNIYAPSFVATGTGADNLPASTTLNRPGSPAEGNFRDNTSLHELEAYINGGWQQIVSGAGGLVNLASQVTGTLPVVNGGAVSVSPEQYGAVGNGAIYFDGAFTASSPVHTNLSTSTTPSTPSVSTHTANDLLVSVFLTQAPWSSSPSVGTTRENVSYTSGSYGMFASDQTISSAGSTTSVSGTLSSSTLWAASSLALAPSGGSVTFVAGNSYQTTNSGVVTLTKPSGTTSGDYLVACIGDYAIEGSTQIPYIKIPLGWNYITANNSSGNNLTCFGKPAGSSEPSGYAFTYCSSLTSSCTGGGAGVIVDYRNTSGVDTPTETLSSATASFPSNSAGDLICVAGITGNALRKQQVCGTISSYISSTQVNVSFPVVNSFTGLQFAYGTNDSSSFNSMLTTAPCSTVGCKIQLSDKRYVLNSGLSLPANIPVSINGVEPGTPNTANSLATGPIVNLNNGTQLLYLTQSMSSAAIAVSGSTNVTNVTSTDELSNFTVYGGTGYGLDGGGGDGIDILNWQSAKVHYVYSMNFYGYGYYVDGLTAGSYKDYIENINLEGVYSSFNGLGGFQLGSSLGVNNLESVQCENCIIEANGGPAVLLSGGNIQGFRIIGSTIQWNNAFGPNTEIYAANNVVGAWVINNYFESDGNYYSQSNGYINNKTGIILKGNLYSGNSTAPQENDTLNKAGIFGFSGNVSASGADTSISRNGWGIIGFGSGGTSNDTTGKITAAGIIIGGGLYGISGCSTSGHNGGATGGYYTSGTNGTCTVTITMGNSAAGNAGWNCFATDRTTNTNVISETSTTTTTVTLSGTTATGDVIGFSCTGY